MEKMLQSMLQPAANNFDNPSLSITIHKINGQNFLRWSQFVKLYIRGKGKIGYLTGSTMTPLEDDPKFQMWDSENFMIISWLINSMESEIGQTYMFLPTAKQVWDVVVETYSDMENSAQVFEITNKIQELKQGNDSVTKYYNTLKGL
ncbi:hypothetical protein CK203_023151 [Vitis vinifera]|uniref:Retrotransposon Copia-like N-terminal domain-containing protein n=1 Tax=Vitis vinifera TaxID=29760 RepID=A0A438J1P3_VITVI|nr:hypothetical protein CK203_023151 [Vitis vinifera]